MLVSVAGQPDVWRFQHGLYLCKYSASDVYKRQTLGTAVRISDDVSDMDDEVS